MTELPLLPPFEKLDGSEDIHEDGCDANRPFCVGGEVEDGEYEQEDARQHPGGVADDGEEGEAAADLRTLRVEGDQRGV